MTEIDRTSGGEQTPSVRDRAIRGVAWNFVNAGSGFVLQLIRAVIMARFLTKADFGLAGKAIAATFLATLFTNFGFSNALVQAKELAQATIESTFTFQFAVGFVLFIGLAIASPFLADFYGDPRLIWLVLILGVGMWVNCAMIVPVALMQRDLEFKELNLTWVSVRFVSFTCAIAMAFAGFGYWSLIVPDLLPRCLALPYLLWHRRWRPALHFAPRDLKPVATFSAKSFGTYWLATANTSLDYAILGRFFSKPVFGLYYFGYQRVRGPMRMGVSSVRSALFPAFSKAKTDEGLRSAMVQSVPILAIIVYPLAACLFLTAPQFVPLIFGPEWHEASPIMQAFTLWALFIPLNLVFNAGFLAKGIFRPSLIEGSARAVLIGSGLIYLGLTEASILNCALWVVVVEALGNLFLVGYGLYSFKISLRWLSGALWAPTVAVLAAAAFDFLWADMRFETMGLKAYGICMNRLLQVLLVSGTALYMLDRESVKTLVELSGSVFRRRKIA